MWLTFIKDSPRTMHVLSAQDEFLIGQCYYYPYLTDEKLRFREIRKCAPNYTKIEPKWKAKPGSSASVSRH